MTSPRTEHTSRRSSGRRSLPGHARAHNRALALSRLFHEGAMSRADLARATGLTRVSVSDLVAALVADGLVVETGERRGSRPGKPGILVDLDRAGLVVVALDLSDDAEYRGAVVDLAGRELARRSVPRPADRDADAALAAAVDLAGALVAEAPGRVLGVGVGAPGVITAGGVVVSSPNLAWYDLPLQERLADALGVPVRVANDANVAALAEHTLGGASDDVLVVRVGRGVGAGLVTNGSLVRGARDAAGEIGHVTVGTDGGPECVCGRSGCLESWLSVRALDAALAAGGDPDAVLRDAGRRLGIAVAPLVGALDLSQIVLSGPADRLDGPLREATADTLRARTFLHEDVEVRMSVQGDDIVLRGAVALVLNGELGIA
ncbi:ROK family transcriptional regulator [Microbacterium excoecariae]|uniref:ROK family transcriptional regulator n=1 Tax=Microbacterium excoecariae TaxID=2715210 RepID=UPI00140B3ED8|nr:ROK family transcriptional regulator [Microbacterium excoecariae]NHI17610.1 ROK family transcriptional regulator [Microbacterium excoecariae]